MDFYQCDWVHFFRWKYLSGIWKKKIFLLPNMRKMTHPFFHDASILVSVDIFLTHRFETVGVFAHFLCVKNAKTPSVWSSDCSGWINTKAIFPMVTWLLQAAKCTLLDIYYHNGPKHYDRHALVNSADTEAVWSGSALFTFLQTALGLQ